MQVLYPENYKMLLREIKDLNSECDHELEDSILLRCQFSAISTKTPGGFLIEMIH